jgi:hypothetical protein
MDHGDLESDPSRTRHDSARPDPPRLVSCLEDWEVTLISGATLIVRAHAYSEHEGFYVFVALMAGTPHYEYELLRIPVGEVRDIQGGWLEPRWRTTTDRGGIPGGTPIASPSVVHTTAGVLEDDQHSRRDGLRVSFDPAASSSDEGLPGFLARREVAPIYHGFTILDGVEADGFSFGTISALGPDDCGDAFIIAPDGSRAGLVWVIGESRELGEIIGFEQGRWGVWAIEFARPMRSREDAQRNLEDVLPALRSKWEAWRNRQPD